MAEIFSAPPAPAPVTPIKSNTLVQTTEVGPDNTPPPTYPREPLFETQASSKDISLNVMPDKYHPVLPVGNVQIDVRNHLSCHNIYNMNIETLLREYSEMKIDLEKSQRTVTQLEIELSVEKGEKQAYKAEAEELRETVKELVYDLGQARLELTITEDKLAQAIKQLMDVAQRLEDAKARLRDAIRERDSLSRALAAKEVELQYCNRRISELELALAIANRGENDANDRNVRLTEMLYEVERRKAAIEKVKDQAEALVRSLRDQLNKGCGGHITTIAELRAMIVILEQKKRELEMQRSTLEASLNTARDEVKAVTEEKKVVQGQLNESDTYSSTAWHVISEYDCKIRDKDHRGCSYCYEHLRNQKNNLGEPKNVRISIASVAGPAEHQAKCLTDDELRMYATDSKPTATKALSAPQQEDITVPSTEEKSLDNPTA